MGKYDKAIKELQQKAERQRLALSSTEEMIRALTDLQEKEHAVQNTGEQKGKRP